MHVSLPLTLLLFLAGCASLGNGEASAIPQGGMISNLEELRIARAYWANFGPEDYTFTLERSCFCPSEYRGPFDVMVRAGAIVRVAREGRSAQASELEQLNIPTIDAIYALVEEAFETGAALVQLEVDPETGAPRDLYLDRDERMMDEELGLTVTRFRPR